MDSLEYMLGENYGVILLQTVILFVALIIIAILYTDQSKVQSLQTKLDNFKCPEIPECPDCRCADEDQQCPDCICDNSVDSGGTPTCPPCPSCPACPATSGPSVNEIVDAIFPGRNQGVTKAGEYFPLSGLGEGMVEPAYSPVSNMVPNYTTSSGVPAEISFSDQMMRDPKSQIGLASQVAPPIATTQGVFTNTLSEPSLSSSQPSMVALPGNDPVAPLAPLDPLAEPAEPAESDE